MDRRLNRLVAIAALAGAAVLAGCGSSSSTSGANASASSSGQLTLSETEFKITPAAPSVATAKTLTITIKNTGKLTHALEIETPEGGTVKSRAISPGSTTTLKVDASKAGRYTFFCPIDHHRQSGMQGVLVVGSASGAGAAGPTTTTSSPMPSGY